LTNVCSIIKLTDSYAKHERPTAPIPNAGFAVIR